MVYLLKAKGTDSSGLPGFEGGERALYKIGYSSSEHTFLQNRLGSLQTGCPFEIDVIVKHPGKKKHDEDLLHILFHKSRFRSGSEWFAFTPKQVQEAIELIESNYSVEVKLNGTT